MKFELNREGVRALLQSSEVQADVRRRAEAIAAAAGEGMEADSTVGRNRARASVRTGTFEARMAESKDRKLTAAIDAGR